MVIRVDAYPMPWINDLINRSSTTLNLARGYWQVPVAKRDRRKTGFTSPMGLLQFKVMPFGLSGALATFQQMYTMLLGD